MTDVEARLAAGPWRPTLARARWAILFIAGLAWASWIDLPSFADEDGNPYTLAADYALGLLLQWSGLIAWRRAGTGRTGPLLYCSGLLWYVGSGLPEPLAWATGPWRGWYEPLLAIVVLGYPTGRLTRVGDRVVLGAMVGAYLVRSLVRMFGFDPGIYFGNPDFVNPHLLFWDETLWATVENLTALIAFLAGGYIVVTCVGRWLRATAPARRTLAPVLVAGIATAPTLGWSALLTPTNVFELPFPDPIIMTWVLFILKAFVPIAILVGIFRLQAARSSLTDLLLELDAGVPVGRLQQVLGRQLGDTSLRLVFPRSDGSLVDGEGIPAPLPVAGLESGITRIDDADGTAIAYIVHDAALQEDPAYVRAAGAAARLSLENERLQAEVRAQLNEVRELSARLVEASDSERRRVERDLHDGAQQRLVTLALRLRLARERSEDDHGTFTAMLTDASAELDDALRDLRELARGIHPAILTRSGLGAAIEALVERSAVPVEVRIGSGRCSPATEVTAYFVIAESLTNIARHASATSATVEADCHDGQLHISISDDGVGGATIGRPGGGSSGLAGLRDRVLAVGGSMDLGSLAGAGTTISAVLPCG